MEDDPLSGAGLAPSRSACPVAVRSVTLSVPDLARSEAFFSRGLGLERSDAALRAPEHEALWGLAGARRARQRVQRRRRPRRARPVSRSGRAAAPAAATGSRIKASSTSPSALGAGASTASSTGAHARPGRGTNRRPLHMPGAGVVYVNDPDQFSVELLWMSRPRSKRWGFTPRPAAKRPRADTHAVERTVRIAAPAQTTWDVIADHENMAEWLGLGSVRRTVDGAPDPDGRGSERLLKLPGASITEQVLAYEPPTSYRYHVTKGSPFVCHQGEIRLRADGDQTELTWEHPLPAKAARNRPPAGDRALPAARARAALRPQAARRSARAACRQAPAPATARNDRMACDGVRLRQETRQWRSSAESPSLTYLVAIALTPAHAPDSGSPGVEIVHCATGSPRSTARELPAVRHRGWLCSWSSPPGCIASSGAPRARTAGSRSPRWRAWLPAPGSSVPAPRCSWSSRTARPLIPPWRGPSGTRAGWPTTPPGSRSAPGSRSSRWRRSGTEMLPQWTAWIGVPVALISFVGPFAVKAGTGPFSPQGWFALVVGLTFARGYSPSRAACRRTPARRSPTTTTPARARST